MAGSSGFMEWLQGLHEGYTNAWANGVIGGANRAAMVIDDDLLRRSTAAIAAQRLAADASLDVNSGLGQALRARMVAKGQTPQTIEAVEKRIYGDNGLPVAARARLIHGVTAKAPAEQEELMALYEAAQNAGQRRIALGDEHSGPSFAADLLAGPQAAYLVPLTGAGLALLGGYQLTRPEGEGQE